MKYCSKCGNELFDYAVVCTKCGCMTEQNPMQQSVRAQNIFEPQETTATQIKKKKFSSLSQIFNFVFDILAIFVILMLGLAIATVYIRSNVYTNTNYKGVITSYSVSSYAYFWPGGTILALIVSFVAPAPAITSFIFALISRTQKSIFSSVKRLILGAALIILSFWFVLY